MRDLVEAVVQEGLAAVQAAHLDDREAYVRAVHELAAHLRQSEHLPPSDAAVEFRVGDQEVSVVLGGGVLHASYSFAPPAPVPADPNRAKEAFIETGLASVLEAGLDDAKTFLFSEMVRRYADVFSGIGVFAAPGGGEAPVFRITPPSMSVKMGKSTLNVRLNAAMNDVEDVCVECSP